MISRLLVFLGHKLKKSLISAYPLFICFLLSSCSSYPTYSTDQASDLVMHLEIEKTDGDKRICAWSFSTADIPQGTVGEVIVVNTAGETFCHPKKMFVDHVGKLRLVEDERLYAHTFVGFCEGEVTKIWFKELGSRRILAAINIVPVPLEVSDDKGHKISATYHDKKGEVLFFRVEGYKEAERLRSWSQSGDEVTEHEFYVRNAGSGFDYVIFPAVIGKRGAKGSLRFLGQDSDLTLEYFWGDEWFQTKVEFPPSPAVISKR